MPDIICLLPDHIANQIAAGEVVQRPSSVVKELIENATDANAQKIQLIIKEAGKALIQVLDDGKGMSVTDSRMCFERHATSKIRKAEDLSSIRTMGFRGEAMASIAAVAQVEMKSRKYEDELGTLIQIAGSEIKKQEPIATNEGTSITIKNLFFNVPARRNFLKSNAVETRHIIDEFYRVALANPKIEFSVFQNDSQTHNLKPGKLAQRIAGLFGKNYQSKLTACSEETANLKLHGYVGTPESAKKTRGDQYFFVNNRFIKSNYFNHAVSNAYEGLIAADSFPFFVLFLEIDPSRIDVNVHPTKTEIKFEDERTIYAIIRASVRRSLGVSSLISPLDYSLDVNFVPNFKQGQAPSFDSVKDKLYSQFKSTKNPKGDEWTQLFPADSKVFSSPQGKEDSDPAQKTFSSSINNEGKEQPMMNHDAGAEEKKPFQLHGKYIIVQVKSGMMIIDQQAAHERILYERYLKRLNKGSVSSQQLLFPTSIVFSPADFALLEEIEEYITCLGFQFSHFGKNTIVINGVPVEVEQEDEKNLFENMIEQYKHNKNVLSVGPKDNLCRVLSKRTSIKHGKALSPEEISSLIDQLFACQTGRFAPDGRGVFAMIDLNTIEKML